MYNPSIGKFLSVDPLAPEYPELTTYQFVSNTPIQAIDLEGLERLDVTRIQEDGEAFLTLTGAGGLVVTYNGMVVKESSTFYQATQNTLNSGGFVMQGNILYKLGNVEDEIQTNPNSFDPRNIAIDPKTGRALIKAGEVPSRGSFTNGNVETGISAPVSGTSILIDITEEIKEEYIDNTYNFVDDGSKGKGTKDVYDVAAKALNRLKEEGVNVDKQYRPDLPLGKSVKETPDAIGEVRYGKVKTRTKTIVREQEIKID